MTTPIATGRGRWAIAALLLATVLAVAALGSGSAGARAPKSVDIADFKFTPRTLHVKAGTKVDFTNESPVTHTATRAGAFDTGHIRPGKSVLVKFAQKGTFAYHCMIHPFMHGTIVVE